MTFARILVVFQVIAALWLLQVFGNKSQLWRRVSVSKARLTTWSRNKGELNGFSTTKGIWTEVYCSIGCLDTLWCNLWCLDSSSTVPTCSLFDMFVSPGYQETYLDALSCYTNKPIDYAVGASITGGATHPATPPRKITNMVDGIYEYENNDHCYYSADSSDPWMKVDFGEIHPVKRVMFKMQHNGGYYSYFDFEVRAGVEDLPESKFSSYLLIGFFPGPTSASQEIIFTPDVPILARYVTFQRWSSGYRQNDLQICHIEIN